ncbi:ADR281Wp [Eremothecium gossypii ATCC 10895]|uniref:ADR281Wp n=1 Tax=Eremothecium gossypii (strain ATCC 10895 / CBS 109.51 / FGSC 9923 / NRRL Y-1056) TaxID=284811 RepID=Q759J6_EREGS|nr:ADR281Wp [Eremothecium gossypii ATCC 10895]AAS52201.2 ADR281Wp [Eremothecium gossypii ATCC 10895]AEY96500.1 FADR281Wp [Eremothecium gossypii FDAG1]
MQNKSEDTDATQSNFGRRTWDREEYARLAQEATNHDHLANLKEGQLALLKAKYTDHHKLILEANRDKNKRVLTTGLTSYKKGKQFGFYCDICDMTFKDTLQYIDHLNHKIHQIKFEQVFGESLVADTRDNEHLDAGELAGEYKAQIAAFVRDNSTRSANEKPKRTNRVVAKDETGESDVERLLGFKSFGSSKR